MRRIEYGRYDDPGVLIVYRWARMCRRSPCGPKRVASLGRLVPVSRSQR